MLAGFDLDMRDKHSPDREVNKRKGGGLFESNSAGQRKTITCGHINILRVCAVLALSEKGHSDAKVIPAPRAKFALSAAISRVQTNLVARADVSYPITNFDYNASAVAAKNMRKRQFVCSGTAPGANIDSVQRCGAKLYDGIMG